MAYYALVLCFVVASDHKTTNGDPHQHTIRECFGCRVVKNLLILVPKMILVQHIFTRGCSG
jgi:hypothetical protein